MGERIARTEEASRRLYESIKHDDEAISRLYASINNIRPGRRADEIKRSIYSKVSAVESRRKDKYSKLNAMHYRLDQMRAETFDSRGRR